ncbi:MAG: hypothetical protein ACREHD_03575 [Pirellulales bacterium]
MSSRLSLDYKPALLWDLLLRHQNTMIIRRVQNFGIAFVGVTMPFFVACIAMALVIWQREIVVQEPVSPNPQKAPLWMTIGPAGLLVYVDPWWAGVILPLMTIVALPVLLYVVAVPFFWPYGLPDKSRRLLLVILSFLVGFFFAAPWLYSLLRLLTNRS